MRKDEIFDILISNKNKSYEFYVGPTNKDDERYKEDGLFVYYQKTKNISIIIFPFKLKTIVYLLSKTTGVEIERPIRNASFSRFPTWPNSKLKKKRHEPIGYKLNFSEITHLKEFIKNLNSEFAKKQIKSEPHNNLSLDFVKNFKMLYSKYLAFYSKRMT
ncbi:hypothetical protein DQ824_22830 [Salmonella enterica subsp. enterica serovar Newport]|nr:hypothetical protein [Salmonella enterica subsp. enterica serovar Newport]